MKFSPLIQSLIDNLKILPSVGPKSAQRMAIHLLERDREGALKLAEALKSAADKVGRCQSCRNLTEHNECEICTSIKRTRTVICVVESPADVIAIEQSGSFDGLYFVLLGHLSPIEGIGPDEIGISLLEERLTQENVNEIILATNPTVEGEATAHYIAERAKRYGVEVSRIAQGVPLGGELEYIDSGTLTHAFSGRRAVER